MISVLKKQNDYKRKSKSERRELKARKANLDVKFRNHTLIHLNVDSDKPTDVRHKAQPTKEQKLSRKYGIKEG